MNDPPERPSVSEIEAAMERGEPVRLEPDGTARIGAPPLAGPTDDSENPDEVCANRLMKAVYEFNNAVSSARSHGLTVIADLNHNGWLGLPTVERRTRVRTTEQRADDEALRLRVARLDAAQ